MAVKGFFPRVKKKFYRIFMLSSANRKYVRLPAVFESIVSADPQKLFMITIAFNDFELIALQHKLLQRFIKDPYEYFVVDNSNHADVAEKIKAYCLEYHINYVRPPENKGWNGMSHGFALNWAYRNIVERFYPVRFGFIDHDMFPVASVSIQKYLDESDAWGIVATRRLPWHLWRRYYYLFIGLAFYRSERFRHRTPNFLPSFGVDTDGRVGLPASIMKVSGVREFFDRETIVVSPGVKEIFRYGAFVHFQGSSDEPPESMRLKRQWLENLLR